MNTTPPHHLLADAMPHIVWTHDVGGTPTYFNRKWTDYTGCDLAEALRIGSSTFVHPADLPEVQRVAHEAMARVAPYEVGYRLRARDGAYRWHVARVAPVRGDGALWWVGTAIDADEQRRVHDEQKFLVEASAVLGTSLDLGTTLGDVARLVVPHLADWCSIDLLTDGGVLERRAVAHVDPSKVALAWELWERYPPQPGAERGAYAVVRTGRSEVFGDIPDELLVAAIADPELLAIMRSLGLRSSMSVPLIVRGRALGVLALVSAELGRHYEARDLAFAEDLGRRIAVAVDNAQLYGAMKEARAAAESMAAEIVEQTREVEAALLAMREERDTATRRIEALEGARGGPGSP
jgi:PAS domain S-box-containing protein